jgi:hypothetical protein
MENRLAVLRAEREATALPEWISSSSLPQAGEDGRLRLERNDPTRITGCPKVASEGSVICSDIEYEVNSSIVRERGTPQMRQILRLEPNDVDTEPPNRRPDERTKDAVSYGVHPPIITVLRAPTRG